MRNLAIITARSGSKGLKDKNIKNLCGKPMIVYTINAARKSGCFCNIMVSTDSPLYADISMKYGAEVPFLRSVETSSDAAASWDVVEEVLNNYLKLGEKFDTVCLLQPTSPLRQAEDIIKGYELFKEKQADAITAVCKAEHAASVYLQIPEDGSLKGYREKRGFYSPRQMSKELFRINGALYIRRVIYENNGIQTLTDKEYAYIMNGRNSIDIDDIFDFSVAEFVLKNNL